MTTADDPRSELLDPREFDRVWRALGAGRSSASVFDEVVERYSEPHRRYHDLRHLRECLDWLAYVPEIGNSEARIAVSIYFHDLVYEPTARDNEQRSSDRFAELAREGGVAPDEVEAVHGLILGTATHQAQSPEGAWMNDIDLSILGAPPTRYLEFEASIREEYVAIEWAAYRRGRRYVLDTFLRRPRIYQTRFFHDRLDRLARDNLTRAIDRLDAAGSD